MKISVQDLENEPREDGNFMGLPPEFSGAHSKFVVIPVAYDAGTASRAGAGPQAMIDASRHMELFDVEIGRGACEAGIHTGKKHIAGRSAFKSLYETIHTEVGQAMDVGKIPVLLGGGNAITVPAVHAALERRPGLTVLHLDAHANLRNAYGGDQWHCSCSMRRILSLADRPPLIVQAGVRSASSEEWALAVHSRSVETFLAREILSEKIAFSQVVKHIEGPVYVSIDLDVFDPAAVPGVAAPEPGGLAWGWVVELLAAVAEKKQIAGFDVVGLCPIAGQNLSEMFAAKLVYRIMGLMV